MIVNQGGSQKAPVISVAESGLITATAGTKSSTLQLSSEHDKDFLASNIRNNVNLFGLWGSLAPATQDGFGWGSDTSYITVPGNQMFVLAQMEKTPGVKFIFFDNAWSTDESQIYCWVWGLTSALKPFVDTSPVVTLTSDDEWEISLSSAAASSAGTNPFKAAGWYSLYSW